MSNEFIAKNGFISNVNATVKGLSGNFTQFLTVTNTGLVTGSGFNNNSFVSPILLASTSASLVVLTSSSSANALVQSNANALSYSSAASANALAQANATSLSNALSYSSAASANALAQANTITFAASANALAQSQTITFAASANALAQSQTITFAASANALAQANTITFAASANALAQANTITFAASAADAIRSASMSANALAQANAYTNIVSGNNTIFSSNISASLNARLLPLENIVTAIGEPNGFENRTSSTLSWDNNSRLFSISGNYNVWCNGIKYPKIGNNQIIPNITGNYFMYYDNSGIFTSSTTPWNILTTSPISYIYWDGTTGILYEERHGIIMDGMTHYYNHTTRGTQYISGLTINGYTLQTDTIAGVDYGVSAGIIADEDLIYPITTLTSGGIYNIWYRSGSGEWKISLGNSLPFLTASNNILYNQFTGGSWQLTQSTGNSDYFNYYLCVSSAVSASQQFFIIPGQSLYTSLALATSEKFTNLSLGTLPVQEMLTLYQITMRRANVYSTTTGHSRIEAVASISNNSVTIAGIVGSSTHNSLAGLQGGTAGEFFHLTSSQYTELIGRSEIASISAGIVSYDIAQDAAMSGALVSLSYSASANALVQSTAMSANALVQANAITYAASANALVQATAIAASMSANALIQANAITYAASANALVQSTAMSANALVQANSFTTNASANLVTYINSGSVSLASVAAASANALVQANAITYAASANAYNQSYSLIASTSAALQSKINNITGGGTSTISGDFSLYTLLTTTAGVSSNLQTQINNIVISSGTSGNVSEQKIKSINKTLIYNGSGTLIQILTAYGSKYLTYTNGLLTAISGTGEFQSKTFSYSGSNVTQINVF